MQKLDMIELTKLSYELVDEIYASEEVKKYLDCKQKMNSSLEAQQLISEFSKGKELLEETKRFGIFHPNYHEAKDKAVFFQDKLNLNPEIVAFLEAESKLDHLLGQVISRIALSVSETIKVPFGPPPKRRGCS